jgi:hypothetical protein
MFLFLRILTVAINALTSFRHAVADLGWGTLHSWACAPCIQMLDLHSMHIAAHSCSIDCGKLGHIGIMDERQLVQRMRRVQHSSITQPPRGRSATLIACCAEFFHSIYVRLRIHVWHCMLSTGSTIYLQIQLNQSVSSVR